MFSENSISIRFTSSLFFNALRGIIVLLTGIFLARELGVEDYGRMSFLLASFTAFKHLIDMYSSHAFFTFLSEETKSKNFIQIYFVWVLIQLIFSLMLVIIFLPEKYILSIWLGESKTIIVLALLATFMQHNAWQIASSMAEAQRETVAVQKLQTFFVLCNLILIFLITIFHNLSLELIFLILSIQWLIASYFASKMYKASNKTDQNYQEIFKKYWDYCKPLILFAWLSFLFEFLDRWMLQKWGGSAEQAYYSISSSLISIILLATISIIKILWKEISEAHKQGNIDRINFIYHRAIRVLYLISVCLCCSIIFWSEDIIELSLGTEYYNAKNTFFILLLLPIHQSIGQIAGSLLLATQRTRLHMILGSIFIVLSIIVAYFVLAPQTAPIPGLNLGSEGLALKLVILQIIQVNVLIYIIDRIYGWNFKFFFQVNIFIIFFALGFISKLLTQNIFIFTPFNIFSSLCLYFGISSLLIFFFSKTLTGITQIEIKSLFHRLLQRFT